MAPDTMSLLLLHHYLPAAALVAALAALSARHLLPTAWSSVGKAVNAKPEESNTTNRALPSQWYRSEQVYELERRAIFSKKWMLVTHKLHLPEIGDWLRLTEAGYDFFLIKDKTGTIRGFHNICRHRAFPIVTKDNGKSSVLACQYHGWSYGLNGNLAKAPGYTDMQGFDKTSNGLFAVHVHQDANGFIWVNLDASKNPEPWSQEFNKVDQLDRHKAFNFDDYRFDHTWGMSGDYNWKTLADNYNECYHCKTSHPDAAKLADFSAYKVEPKGGNIEHFANLKPTQNPKDAANVVSNYYFPNSCMSVTPHFFYLMRCVPTAASHCSMEYEVYRHKDASDEDFENIDAIFKRILGEDKWLCNNAQKNLNAGVFINGEMHSKKEQGPLYFQTRVRELLFGHQRLEKDAGREIHPAQQVLSGRTSMRTEQDLTLCSGFACGKEADALAW